jgi:hypothetical protein
MSRLVGHYAPRLLVVLVAGLITLTLVPAIPVEIAVPVLVVLLAVTLVLAVSLFAHNRGLCERCIASLPLAASAAANKYPLRFRIAHLFERKVFAFGYVAVIAATSLLYFHPAGKYAWAVAQLSLVYLVLVYTTHQKLQPWCPYCKNGGEEQTTPTAPTPVSTSH